MGHNEAAFPGREMLLVFVGFGVGIWTRILESWAAGGWGGWVCPVPSPSNQFHTAVSCIPGIICLDALEFDF